MSPKQAWEKHLCDGVGRQRVLDGLQQVNFYEST